MRSSGAIPAISEPKPSIAAAVNLRGRRRQEAGGIRTQSAKNPNGTFVKETETETVKKGKVIRLLPKVTTLT